MSSHNLPSREVLEAAHDFPGQYTFKVIGKVEDGFVARVMVAVREELEVDTDPPFTLRQTPSGRHVAITLQPHVDSVYRVLAVYQRLCDVSGLVMLF